MVALGLLDHLLDNYHYYDKPEGQDPIGKLVGLSKYSLITGSAFALGDGLFYSKCVTSLQALNTWGYWVVPMCGMGLAFSSVTYISTNVRGKDDNINYALGVAAAGGVFHAWQKDPMRSGFVTAMLFLYSVIKKETKRLGIENPILPTEKPKKWFLPWRQMDDRDWSREERIPRVKDYWYNW